MPESAPATTLPARPRRARRLLYALCLLALLWLLLSPAAAFLLPRLLAPYINGDIACGGVVLLPHARAVRLTALRATDTAGSTLFTIDSITARWTAWQTLPSEIVIMQPACTLDAPRAAALAQWWRGTGSTDTSPLQLPALLSVREARLAYGDETRTVTLTGDAEARTAAGTTALHLQLRHERGWLEARAAWEAATGAVREVTLSGELRGESTTLHADLRGGFVPGDGLTVERLLLGDGIDTIAGEGTWHDTQVALTLRARQFDFGARYPELAGLRGDLLELSAEGSAQQVRCTAAYAAPGKTLQASGTVWPAEWRVRLDRAEGRLPSTGTFSARGEAWRDTDAVWHWQEVTADVQAWRSAIAQSSGHYAPDGSFTIRAATYRYDRYLLQQPDGEARWADGKLTVARLAAGGLDGSLVARGELGFTPVRGDITVAARQVKLAAIDRLFRAELGDSMALTAGTLSADIGVRWGNNWTVAARNLVLQEGGVRLAAGTLRGIGAAGALDVDGRGLRSSGLRLRALEGTLDCEGNIGWQGDGSITARATDLALPQLQTLLQAQLAAAGINLAAGTAGGTVRATWADGRWQADISDALLRAATVQYGTLGAVRDIDLRASLTLAPQQYRVRELRGTLLGGNIAGSGEISGRSGAVRLALDGIKFTALDTLLRARLAKQEMRLTGGELAGALDLSLDSGWHVVTREPLAARGIAVWQRRAGTMRNLDLLLDVDARAGNAVLRRAVLTLPSGEIRAQGRATGTDYEQMEGTVEFAQLKLAEAVAPLAQLCRDSCRLTSVSGEADGSIRIMTEADGMRLGGTVQLREVGAVLAEPNVRFAGLNGTLSLDSGAILLDEARGYLRERFDAGWQELAPAVAPNVTCRELAAGDLTFTDLRLKLAVTWPRLVLEQASWRLFGGECRARGRVAFVDDGQFALTTLFDNLSLRRVCATFPGIENYLTGKVRGTLWLKGEQLTLPAVRGLVAGWVYRSDDEPMTIHRDMLIRLGGETVRRQGLAQRETLPLDLGELTTRVEAGKMNFEELRLESTTLFTTIRVVVPEGHDRIGIEHFLRTINVLAGRGTQVDVNF